MEGDIQKPKEFPTSAVPEQYRPYSSTELTDKQIEFARKYRNETEETRKKGLRRIKRYVKREFDAFSEMDDIFFLAFLRSKMFDFKQTCLLMKKTAEYFEANSSYINKIDTEIICRIVESKALCFLPYRDAKGRAIILLTAEKWDPNDLKVEDAIFGTFVLLYASIENPVNQVSGYVCILDFKSVTFQQFREAMNWIFFVIKFIQDCYPAAIREVHVLHTPALVMLGWKIVSAFVDEDVKKLVTFHNSYDWERLHDKIPPCILPEEAGGQLRSFSSEHWASDITMLRKKFFDRFHKSLNTENVDSDSPDA